MRKALRCLGERDTEGLQILHELAEILVKQEGRVKEAEVLARKAVRGRERVLGVKAQVTLESVWLLGQVCEKVGKKSEAMGLYKKAYIDGRVLLGESHVDVKDYKKDHERLGEEGWMDVGSWLYSTMLSFSRSECCVPLS
jgi:hypothetical protein